MEEDLQWEVPNAGDREFLEVLGEAAVALGQDRAPAFACNRSADGASESVTHAGESLVADHDLAGLLLECLHLDG